MSVPVVRLVGDINEETISPVIEELSHVPHNAEKVVLVVDSDGGSLEEGFRLIDAIRIVQSKGLTVHSVITGKAYSMGIYIALAAKERTAYPSARIMTHCARYDGLGEDTPYTAKDLKTLYQEMDMYDRLLKGVMVSAGVDPQTADILMSKDTYFGVDQAIQLGLVQSVERDVI